MRIAVINWSDRHVGGAETYIAQVLSGLSDAGHEVVLWHETTGPDERPAIARPATVTTIDGAWARNRRGVERLREWQPDLLFIHGLVDPECERSLQDLAPSVLFGHGYYGTCITGSKTCSLPAVAPCTRRFGTGCLVQFYPRRCGGRSPFTMWTEYRRQSARLANLARFRAVLTFSEHMRQEFEHHGVPASRIHRVPAILERRRFPGARPHGDHHRLLFAGRLDRLKGCRVLIEALPDVHARTRKPLTLAVAGTGPDEQNCRAAANDVLGQNGDVRVEFLGWRPRHELDSLVTSSSLVVMPSLWPEPFGLAGLEAVSSGVPVAAFAVGGIPEWLQEGVNGALAPADPPTPSGLADAIVRALENTGLADSTRRWAGSVGSSSIAEHVALLGRMFALVIASDRSEKVAVGT